MQGHTEAQPPLDIAAAIQKLRETIHRQCGGDLDYFEGQLPRYAHTVRRITQLFPLPCRILDVGSHYLHQASLLSLLGYEVAGLDLRLFAEADFVRARAEEMRIDNHATDSLEDGTFLPAQERSYDLIVFTEIIEHITFNPVRFWSRVYELLAPSGAIYLTTPNAMRPAAILDGAARLVSLRGIGISVPAILGNVTYGHHWKEYSAYELRQYFHALSRDFEVSIEMYSLPPGNRVKRALMSILALVPAFRSDIEAVVRLAGRTRFLAEAPQLAMERRTVKAESTTD